MIRSGSLREVITIQQQTVTQDSYGQPLISWNTIVTCRASIQRTTGREVFESATRAARVPTIFHMRYQPGITPDMRVVLELAGPNTPRVFDIKSVIDPTATKEQLILQTEELVGQAP